MIKIFLSKAKTSRLTCRLQERRWIISLFIAHLLLNDEK